jgi:diaminohydroxyphosphoribosylaminopyrimidine deaminase/5-amino-6-(5-phosphoribosylamino)uracil reductase
VVTVAGRQTAGPPSAVVVLARRVTATTPEDAVTSRPAREAERDAMRRAIALAATALGSTNPNPAVGAVLIDDDGSVLAEGATAPAGGEHAEVVVLRTAARTAGATLVVTLEPCRHVGRTGPCTEAILAAGVRRVVYAVGDPHSTAGGGGEQLRDRGVDVESGVLADEAALDLQPWLLAVGRRRAHVTWKYAATLDGRTAAADATSRWITGATARADAHRERALADAVVVGIGTVLADDTRLTVRDWPAGRQPLRVVVDGAGRTPLSARILDGAAATLIAVGTDVDPGRAAALEAAGATVLRLPRREGRVDLAALVAALFEREVLRLLVEGGATLAGSFARAGLVDRVVGYHAPLLLGAGRPVLADTGVATLTDATRLRVTDVTCLGGDVRITAERPLQGDD